MVANTESDGGDTIDADAEIFQITGAPAQHSVGIDFDGDNVMDTSTRSVVSVDSMVRVLIRFSFYWFCLNMNTIIFSAAFTIAWNRIDKLCTFDAII